MSIEVRAYVLEVEGKYLLDLEVKSLSASCGDLENKHLKHFLEQFSDWLPAGLLVIV